MDKSVKDILIATSGVLLAYLKYTEERKKKRLRRYAVRPMNRDKNYSSLYGILKFSKTNDIEQFCKYTRMTPGQFDSLLQIIGSHITKRRTKRTLTPEQKLAMTLHYLAAGCSMQEIFYVGKATVHCVIKEVCTILWKVLQPMVLPSPSLHDFMRIENGFSKRWQMPNCIGAIDGKHVVIQSPYHAGSQYYSYKKMHSIILLASCDAFYKFTMVDIGQAGSNHDGYVFRESSFGKRLFREELGIPIPKCLPNTNIIMPHFLVGDQAFPLHNNIMRPYPGTNLSDKQNIFNYRLSRARRNIENTFGILTQRWRILRGPIIANIDMCEHMVKAVVVLHNFIQKNEEDLPDHMKKYCPIGMVDQESGSGELTAGEWRSDSTLQSVGRLGSNNANRQVQLNRDVLCDYLESPLGCVPWQLNHVRRGHINEQQ